MRRSAARAGCGRTITRGVPPRVPLTESLSEDVLYRLAPDHDPDGLTLHRRDASLHLTDFTMTGHLTGERIA